MTQQQANLLLFLNACLFKHCNFTHANSRVETGPQYYCATHLIHHISTSPCINIRDRKAEKCFYCVITTSIVSSCAQVPIYYVTFGFMCVMNA